MRKIILLLGIVFLAPAGYGQNVLIEKVLYSSPNSIDLLSANRTSGLVYFKTDDTFSLLYADVRNGKIVLDSTVSNLTNISNNLTAGRGRIEDADFAAETTTLAKTQILQQASTAMLAQANACKQNVLSLLQG